MLILVSVFDLTLRSRLLLNLKWFYSSASHMPGCQASIIMLGSRVISFISTGCPVCCPLKAVWQFCFCCCDDMPWESARETKCSLAHSSELGSVSARKTLQGFRQLTPLHLSPRSSAEGPHACMVVCHSAEWLHACVLVHRSAEWLHACILVYNSAEWSYACTLVHSSPCLHSSEPPF